MLLVLWDNLYIFESFSFNRTIFWLAKLLNPIKVGPLDQQLVLRGGLQDPDNTKYVLPIYLIVLKPSLGIFRKNQRLSEFNFDHKGD